MKSLVRLDELIRGVVPVPLPAQDSWWRSRVRESELALAGMLGDSVWMPQFGSPYKTLLDQGLVGGKPGHRGARRGRSRRPVRHRGLGAARRHGRRQGPGRLCQRRMSAGYAEALGRWRQTLELLARMPPEITENLVNDRMLADVAACYAQTPDQAVELRVVLLWAAGDRGGRPGRRAGPPAPRQRAPGPSGAVRGAPAEPAPPAAVAPRAAGRRARRGRRRRITTTW